MTWVTKKKIGGFKSCKGHTSACSIVYNVYELTKWVKSNSTLPSVPPKPPYKKT